MNGVRLQHVAIFASLLYSSIIPASIASEQQPISTLPSTPTPAIKQVQHAPLPPKKSTLPQKPAEPTDEEITIFNATPVTISIRYERIGNPGIIESIKPNSMITIKHKPGTPMVYSLESGGQTAPITPDMIVHGQITIKVPPELMQSTSTPTSNTPAASSGTAGTPPVAPASGTQPAMAPNSSQGIIPQTPPTK